MKKELIEVLNLCYGYFDNDIKRLQKEVERAEKWVYAPPISHLNKQQIEFKKQHINAYKSIKRWIKKLLKETKK